MASLQEVRIIRLTAGIPFYLSELTVRRLFGMFRNRLAFHPDDSPSPAFSNYGARVRAAHELADLLKRNRPHLYEQVNDLQATIVRCQQTLDLSKAQNQSLELAPSSHALPDEIKAALEELETTSQALLDLRHKGQMAR